MTLNKTETAYNYLKELIDTDQYSPGDRLPTEIELNKALGINRQTIAKALALLKNEGLIERVAGRGTTLLRKPSEGLCKTLLIISPWPEWSASGNWYFASLLYALQTEALKNGLFTLNTAVHASRGDQTDILKIRNLFHANKCEGIIIVDPFIATHRLLKNLQDELNCPSVWAGSSLHTYKNTHRVDIDNFLTAKELTLKLIDDGASDILFMSGALNTTARQRRLDGYKSALDERGIPFNEQLIICHSATHLDEAGSECAALYAARWLNADAIFLNDFEMIQGIQKFCDYYPSPALESLKKLPVATFDYNRNDEPSIRYSAIQPIEQIGKQAIQTLLEIKKNKASDPIVKTLPAKIIKYTTDASPS